MSESTIQQHTNQPVTYRGDQVPCHRVIELTLTSPQSFANPLHQARFTALFTAPSGRQITWHGFWDGGNEWRVRFSPDEEGPWHYTLDLEQADGDRVATTQGIFTATSALAETPFDLHGPIMLAADKCNLVHADGTPYFWLADTAWNGPLRSTDAEWHFYLETRKRQGFGAVQWVATHWRSSHTDIEGTPTFSQSDPITIEPAFFQRLDSKVESLAQAGLLSAPVMLWAVGSGANPEIDPGIGLPEGEAILLARYQVARWAAYPLVWILGGDGKYAVDFAPRWRAIGRATFGDQPHAPVAMHCGGQHWPADDLREEEWMGILGYQSGHGDSDQTLEWIVAGPPATDWNKQPRLFQLNLEPAYENHLAYHSRQPHTATSVRMAIYWSLLNAPTAGVSYGGHGVWGWDDGTTAPADHPGTGVPLPWKQAITMPAAEQVRHIRDAFTNIAWWTLTPAPHLLLDQPGSQDVHRHILVSASESLDLIVAYTPMGDAIRLDSINNGTALTARWFNPRTGERSNAQAQGSDSKPTYAPPTQEDWLLVLQSQK